jgi:hypothetical protein
VLSVEDWSEILGLHRAEQMPIKVIARTLGMAGNRVRAVFAPDGPPTYQRGSRGRAWMREQVEAVWTMRATVNGERVGAGG